jgi:hypothetical protein
MAADWSMPWAGAAGDSDGLPFAGNGAFGLSIATVPPAPINGVLGVSFEVLSPGLPVGGGTLCVNVFNPGLSVLLPISGPSGVWSLPLGIPFGLSGYEVYFQAALSDGAGFALTSALAVTIL